MIVISIVSILLLFSFPVVKDLGLFSNSSRQAGDIIRLINNLKKRAIEQHLDFLLHMDSGSNVVWVTDDAMNNEAKETAKDKGTLLSDDLTILDVEFPGVKETGAQEYRIRFKKQGYSDFALIHMVENGENLTLKIEPFLSQVQLLDRHVYLEDCL